MVKEVQIGNYTDLDSDPKAIKLSLSLPALEVANVWSRCGLIANFGSSYIAVANPRKKNIANSLSFILNELIENAVKYAYPRECILKFSLTQHGRYIVMSVTNPISPAQADTLVDMAHKLIDPVYVNTRYIDILTASGKSAEKSGIGLLTIMNYYQANLSFRIGSATGGDDHFSIEAKIDIEGL